ncbi:unnamed protein product [Prunus brigantina]
MVVGFAVVVRGTTSLNGAWGPEATWLSDHSILGRVSYGPRPRPIRLWSRGRANPAFVFSLFFEEGKMLDKTHPFPFMNRCSGREEVSFYDCVLLGTNSNVIIWLF